MATFQELLQLAEITKRDKTSIKRMHEIEKILRKSHAFSDLTPEKAKEVLVALGPTFVKIGQLASERSDIIPPAYAHAFEDLRINVPPEPYSVIEECINESLGHPWQETFVVIDQEPLGSASVAQVHRGVLRAEGNPVVAIKVQRPNAARQMAEDITLLRHILALVDVVSPGKQEMVLSLEDFVEELANTTEQELNFLNECHNLERFQELLASVKGVSSPKPYSEVSSEQMLVMEYVQGVYIDEVEELIAQGYNPDELGKRLAENYIKQVLDWGFFHADPHPGNILVRDGVIVWIDLGMMGKLSSSDRYLVESVFASVAQHDAFKLKDALLTMANAHGPVNHGELLEELSNMITQYTSQDLAKLDVGALLLDVINILREQNLELPASLTMLARGAVTVEGVMSVVSPNTNIISIVNDHERKEQLKISNIKNKIEGTAMDALNSADASLKLPVKLAHTLDVVNRGQLQGTLDMNVSRSLLASIYAVSQVLALALIATGLFVGSSLIVLSGMQPMVLNVPALGFVGIIAACILSAYVVYRCMSLRHKQINDEELE